MEARKHEHCIKHSASLPTIARAVSFAAVEGEHGTGHPAQLLRSASDSSCEKAAEHAAQRGFYTSVSKCRNCGFTFFASYSKGGADFCSLDCRTSCEWLKLIKEQKQSARQVTNQLAHIPAPFPGAAPAFSGKCAAEPSEPIQMNAAPQSAAIPIAMA